MSGAAAQKGLYSSHLDERRCPPDAGALARLEGLLLATRCTREQVEAERLRARDEKGEPARSKAALDVVGKPTLVELRSGSADTEPRSKK